MDSDHSVPTGNTENVILAGMKHCGKSTLGRRLAWDMKVKYVDLDDLVEAAYRPDRLVGCRQIYRQHGAKYFADLEAVAAERLAGMLAAERIVCSLGGGTIENTRAMRALSGRACLVYIEEDENVLFRRIMAGGLPAFLSVDDPAGDFARLYDRRTRLYRDRADVVVPVHGAPVDEAYALLTATLQEAGCAG